MRSRAGRIVLFVVLLIVAASAAVITTSLVHQVDELGQTEQLIADRIERLHASIHRIGDAQLAYVTPDLNDGVTPEQVPTLITQVLEEVSAIEHHVRAQRSMTDLKTIADQSHQLAEFESKAQEHVRLGQELMAADVISVSGLAAITVMTTAVGDLRSAEVAAIEAERTTLLRQAWMVLGGAAGVWAIGLLSLVPIPRPGAIAPQTTVTAASAIRPSEDPIDQMRGPAPPTTDLAMAAELCTEVARIADAGELAPLLTQAAQILGAPGVVVWMAAGEELIAAAAHGYDANTLARLGRIQRAAPNATAAAWRQGRVQVVESDEQSRGAVVAPVMGRDRCIGVLAVELPHGRETDAATHAITRFLAAQLAATLAPWPAASIADNHMPLDKAAEA